MMRIKRVLERTQERSQARRNDVHIYSEDCNRVLLRDVFPKANYTDYRRALCLLDPYNINLKWEVIETAGQMGSVEVFLNFMIMDINRNALRRNRDSAIQSKIDQLTALWGDGSVGRCRFQQRGGSCLHDPEKGVERAIRTGLARATKKESRVQIRFGTNADEDKE